MSSKGNKSLHRCIFCNSLSHVEANCNSNMKGRRQMLTDIGRNFMLEDTLPNFKSFPINELRFIASKYEVSQKIPNKRDVRTCMSRYFGRECEVEYLYSPIPPTLTKSRMISDFVRRWTIYESVRNNHNHEKPEDEDCPICMDCMSTSTWNPRKLNWDMVAAKSSVPDALFANNIRTQCGHTFCGGCWELHVRANSKFEYHENRFHEEPTGRMVVSCPMCRHKMHYVR
jgi:hypothetical protein